MAGVMNAINVNIANAFGSVEMLAGNQWSLGNFLKNSTNTIGNWISLAVVLLGVVAIGWSVWMIVSGLMSQGRKQTNWAIAIILLLVGGVLAVGGGFDFVKQIAGGGQATIEDLGRSGGTIIFDYMKLPFFK